MIRFVNTENSKYMLFFKKLLDHKNFDNSNRYTKNCCFSLRSQTVKKATVCIKRNNSISNLYKIAKEISRNTVNQCLITIITIIITICIHSIYSVLPSFVYIKITLNLLIAIVTIEQRTLFLLYSKRKKIKRSLTII